jgi:hypothetical protein
MSSARLRILRTSGLALNIEYPCPGRSLGITNSIPYNSHVLDGHIWDMANRAKLRLFLAA